jgi:hypothetical protein
VPNTIALTFIIPKDRNFLLFASKDIHTRCNNLNNFVRESINDIPHNSYVVLLFQTRREGKG